MTLTEAQLCGAACAGIEDAHPRPAVEFTLSPDNYFAARFHEQWKAKP